MKQYKKIPIISINVARNGAAEWAGSIFIRSKNSGRRVPSIIETTTMADKEMLMAIAA